MNPPPSHGTVLAQPKTQAEVAEETEVLSLEAQSLSAKVSAALQRGLDAAADDLVAARRKSKRAGGGKAAVTAAAKTTHRRGEGGELEGEEGEEEEYGESVYGISTDGSAELAQQHPQQAGEYFTTSASPSASDSVSVSASAPASASGSSKAAGSSGRPSVRLQGLTFRGGPTKGGSRGG